MDIENKLSQKGAPHSFTMCSSLTFVDEMRRLDVRINDYIVVYD